MAVRKAGITAIKRVIEDELRTKIMKENAKRKARWQSLGKAVEIWALKSSPLGSAKVKGAKVRVSHDFLLRRNSSLPSYYGRSDYHSVDVILDDTSEGITGSLTHSLDLPPSLLSEVKKNKEISFNDLRDEAELLASRVLLKGEGGDLQKVISEVVDAFIKEKAGE